MRLLLYILLISIYNISFCQSDEIYTKWTNGQQFFWAGEYNDSLILFEGGDLHEGGSMFTLQKITKDSFLLIGRHIEEDFDPSFGKTFDRVKFDTINGIKVLIFQNRSGLIKYILREMVKYETLEKLIIKNKINHELTGRYIDDKNNQYTFYPNFEKADGLTDNVYYDFGYEYDSPIDVLIFNDTTSFYYKITDTGMDLFKAKQDNNDYWDIGDKISSLTKTEWINTTDNKELKGKYPFASTDLLIDGIFIYYNKAQLKIMRNEIFARYGYIFKTPQMSNYFESRDWYIPKYDDVNDKLTELEKLNIKLIQYIENK